MEKKENIRSSISNKDKLMLLQKDYEKGLKIYREILPQLVDYQERMTTLHKYIDFSLQYAQSMTKDKKWVEAVEIYREKYHENGNDYLNMHGITAHACLQKHCTLHEIIRKC